MASQDSRPVNLDLTKFSFPVTAIASIAHRVCAVISWVGIAALIAYVYFAKGSLDEFNATSSLIENNFFIQFCLWGFASAFGYYCTGTAKHLIQDLGYFEDFEGGKLISWAALLAAAVLSAAIGAMIWA